MASQSKVAEPNQGKQAVSVQGQPGVVRQSANEVRIVTVNVTCLPRPVGAQAG